MSHPFGSMFPLAGFLSSPSVVWFGALLYLLFSLALPTPRALSVLSGSIYNLYLDLLYCRITHAFMSFFLYFIGLPSSDLHWYNHYGWMGIKIYVTYLLLLQKAWAFLVGLLSILNVSLQGFFPWPCTLLLLFFIFFFTQVIMIRTCISKWHQ